MEMFGKMNLILVFILLVLGKMEAKVATGNIDSETNVVYIDQFYFGNDGNNILTFDLRYPSDQCCYKLVAFDDSPMQWTYIRPFEDRLSCENRLARVENRNFKLSLSKVCQNETDHNGRSWLVCKGKIDFSAQNKPRWYFLHLLNCNGHRISDVTYNLHMTNGDTGLHREFSANRILMLETDMGYLLGYLVLTFIGTRYGMTLSKRRLLHLTYKLFYLSLLCQTASLFCHSLGLFLYARSGMENIRIQDTAEIFSCLSCIVFVSVLLLVAKGFSITRVRISRHGTIKVFICVLIYSTFYLLCYVYQQLLLDPRDILRKDLTKAAGGLIGLQLLVFILLAHGVFFTLKDHPRKAPFYCPFILFFGAWTLTEPVCTILSVYAFPELKSENLTNLLYVTLTFCGHAYFTFLTRPNEINQRFPFHIRTNKIEFGDSDEEESDNAYHPSDHASHQTDYAFQPTDRIDTVNETKEMPRPPATPSIPEHYETPVVPFDAELPTVSDPPPAVFNVTASHVTADTYTSLEYDVTSKQCKNFSTPNRGFDVFCVEKPKTEAFRLASEVTSEPALTKKDPSIPYSAYELTPVNTKVNLKEVSKVISAADDFVYQVTPKSSSSSVASVSVPYNVPQTASGPVADPPLIFEQWFNDPELIRVLESDPEEEPPRKPKTQVWTKEQPTNLKSADGSPGQLPQVECKDPVYHYQQPTKTNDGSPSQLAQIECRTPAYNYHKINWEMVFGPEELLRGAGPREPPVNLTNGQRPDGPSMVKSGLDNNGDIPKKIRREPNHRRFAKPGTEIQDSNQPTLIAEKDAASTKQTKKSKKSKKRLLKKFLKMARKRKPNKPQNPEKPSSASPPHMDA